MEFKLKMGSKYFTQFLFILCTGNSTIPVNIINEGMFKYCDNFHAPLCPCYGNTDTDNYSSVKFDLVA